MRIALRLLGLVLLVLCFTSVALLFKPGPAAVAEAMGVSCGDDHSDASSQCSAFDAASVLWTVIWVSFIAGVALRIGARAKGKGPMVLNLRRR
jgi:hypothetical protein